MINVVILSKRAKLDLKSVPIYIRRNLLAWVSSVETEGLEEIRKIPGYHDEPLKGNRVGERSIRLNRSYRAIYIIKDDGTIEFLEVLEVNKHDY
jgi:proteic killer suppression protein